MNNDNKLEYSLNSNEMQYLNKDAIIIPYTALNKIFDLDDLFKNTNKVIILYLLKNKHYGHWTCLFKPKNKNLDYYFYDSYGYYPDDELDKIPFTKRIQLNEEQDRLKKLLSMKRYDHNQYTLQGKGTSTCGMHVSHRLNNSHMSEKDYIKFFVDNKIKNPDVYVSSWCLKKLNENKI